MKLKSKNSFLKRIACIALSAMLCLTSFTLSGFAPTLEAEAATNANITVSGYGVLIGDEQNRVTGNALTIVNDQQNANFSVGFVEFDLSSINISSLKENKSVVTSANYTFTYSIGSSEREAMGLSCYYSTQNDSELVGTGAKINSGTAKNTIFTGDDGDHISRAVSHFGLKKIADYNTKVNSSATYTVNLTTMINYAIQNNRTKVRLIIMLKQPGGLSGPDWSDTIVTASTGAVTTSFGHEVMGNVTTDPIIYIHGDYTGGLSNGDQYDYMMQGDVVADGSYDGECKTAVSSTKTITNVEVVDTNNCLYVESGILKGSLGGGYANESSYTTTSTATLRFTFDDNTYEYHKLAVKPNPVATHTLSASFVWAYVPKKIKTGRSDSAFEVLAKGSYGTFGDSSGGSYSVSSTSDKKSEYSGSQNYGRMYAPCDSGYDTLESDSNIYINTLNYGTTDSNFSRKTGYYATYCWNKNGSRDLIVNSKEAVYYLDLSSSNNYGVTHTAGNKNYSIQLFVGNLYWNSETNTSTCSKDVDSIAVNSGSSTMSINTDSSLNSINSNERPSATTGYVTVSGSASVGETTGTHSIKYQTPISVGSIKTSSQINTNIKLVVSDKTTVRNYYNTKITQVKSLDSRCYTTASWKALSDALLDVEEYLNDNTDISSKDTTTLENAYKGLTPSNDVSVHNFGSATKITTTDKNGKTLQVHKKTCTRCNYQLTENHKLSITGTTASCSECDYSANSGYTPNGFRITKGNLFDVDAYAATDSATINSDRGAVSVDTTNDTITVAGNDADAYTNYAATGDYFRIPVSQLQWYTISYTPSIGSNQVFAFFSDGTNYFNAYDTDTVKHTWNSAKYSAPANEEYKLTFQAPQNCVSVDFRFGVLLKGEICTFSNISFYESDEYGNPRNGYEVLAENVPSGSNVLNSLNIPSADKCNASYDMYEKKTPVGEGDTVTTNLNITLDTKHAYGNFTNDYTKGLSYDKNKTYTHSRSCTDCLYPDTQSCKFGNLKKDGNTATLTCSDCNGTYTLDLEAYNKAVAEANTSINNTVAYTPGSINDLSLVLSEQATKLNSAKTQDDVDSCTETIISKNKLAKDGGVLVLEQYAITVKYFDATGNDLAVGEKGATYKTYPAVNYGSIQNIVAPISYDGKKYSVYKWTRDRQGSNTISGLNSSSLDVVVKGASTYYVFLKRTSVDDTKVNDNAVITLNNKSGKVVDIGYVAMNKDEPTKATVTVNTNAGTITIGNTTLTAPKYSFYNLSGFTINNVDASTLPTITLTKNVVIKPVYTPSHKVTITRANAGIRINGQDVDSYDADWNRKVVMTYNGEVPVGQVVIWKDGNGNVLAQGSTYSFYANSNVTISATVETSAPKDPTASIGLFSYDPTDNKVTVVNNFFVPDGMKVTKAGVILSTKNSKREALIAQTNGKFEGGPESFTSTGNQIRISVSRSAKTEFTMYALAYVVVNGQPYYANEVRTINYTPKSAQ